MPRLSDIQNDPIKSITVEYNGLEIAFDVDPNKFTLGWQKRVREAADANDMNGLSTTFFSLVKGWDIEDDAGTVLPLDVSAFDQLTVPTFVSLSGLIMEKLVPNAPMRS